MKKSMALLMFSLTLTVLPMLSNLAASKSQAVAIHGIYSENKDAQATAAVIEVGTAVAFGVGAICPPQMVFCAALGL